MGNNNSQKIIAVVGATGAQGGSVLRSLSNAGFQVRALTRNAGSDKAKALATQKNVTVVEASLDDVASLDAAFKGAYGVFLVTDFTAHMELKEVQQGKRAIDSAIRAGVSHLVFSGLENAKSVTGKDVFHFDFKREIEEYALEQADKINFTSVRLAAYYENFPNFIIQKTGDKQFIAVLPMADKHMFGVSVDDLGGIVLNVFEHPEDNRSKVLGIAGAYLTGDEYIAKLNKHLAPNKFTYVNMPLEQYEQLPFPGASDLARMFEFFQSEKMVRDIPLSKRLNKNLLDFDGWLGKNKQQLLQRLQ